MRKINYTYIIIVLIIGLFFNCKEPFDIESIDFINAFVVESTITNELKFQQVKITKTYTLDSQEPEYENNASVWIEDNFGSSYSFIQNEEGIYISEQEFQALQDRLYQLFIITQDGGQYKSTRIELAPNSEITNLYAESSTKNNGEIGVQVYLDSDNENSDAQYFRYEYTETYKIIAPEWHHRDIIIENFRSDIDEGFKYDIIILPREQEERICFKTINSLGVIQTSTNDLEENKIYRFPIIFINKNSSVLRDRYSILVKQYTQSIEAYTYYKMINDLGDSGSILSPNQPGFVQGNISSETNKNEKVLGYFDVSNVDSKRIYFNYADFTNLQPPYEYSCDKLILNYYQYEQPNERQKLYQRVTDFNYKLRGVTGSVYTIVKPQCGDCTTIASNIRPEFWED